jgi:uncharacterized protein YfaQ (DUF2300 family)
VPVVSVWSGTRDRGPDPQPGETVRTRSWSWPDVALPRRRNGGPAYAIDDQTAITVVDGTVDVVSEGHWQQLRT